MSDRKILAGPALRRLRRTHDLTQAAMAERLGISPSYLNLLESNQRPLSARLMVALAETFGLDPREFASGEAGGGIEAMRRRLHHGLFEDIAIDRDEIEQWLMTAPNAARAFAELFDRMERGGLEEGGGGTAGPVARVRAEIERWRGHYADLDHAAEELADELRLGSGELGAAIAERLRVRHKLSIRILPATIMPGLLRRLDLHARQLQLSETLDHASRTFQAAFLIAQLEQGKAVEALVAGAGFEDPVAEHLYRRHLNGYFAAALMMPYGRFLRACEQTGYDIFVLQRRFGAGFEQVAHRLTTLQRVGARGLPFFMVRIDRAGQFSKRFAGASGSPLADSISGCPIWLLHHVFERPSEFHSQLVELEDGSRWFTLARRVQGAAFGAGDAAPEFAIGLGVAAELAGALCYARGLDLNEGEAAQIGLGCSACTRPDCGQRSAAPQGAPLVLDEHQRGLTPFHFAR